MDEKRAAKRGGEGGGAAGEAKPGGHACWEDCRMVEDLLALGRLGEDEGKRCRRGSCSA